LERATVFPLLPLSDPRSVQRPQPQPVKAAMAARRLTVRAAAASVPCHEHHLSRVLNGYVRPSARVRDALVRLLDAPEGELFWPEARP
jgi:hypothetical protein